MTEEDVATLIFWSVIKQKLGKRNLLSLSPTHTLCSLSITLSLSHTHTHTHTLSSLIYLFISLSLSRQKLVHSLGWISWLLEIGKLFPNIASKKNMQPMSKEPWSSGFNGNLQSRGTWVWFQLTPSIFFTSQVRYKEINWTLMCGTDVQAFLQWMGKILPMPSVGEYGSKSRA